MSGRSSYGYPKEIYHPDGFTTMIAFDADDEKQIQKRSEEFRNSHQAANAAAHAGTDAPAPKTASK